MHNDCIFCKIVAGEIPATRVYEDEHVLAFADINPIAPIHVLVIPKRHVVSTHDLHADDSTLLGQLFAAIKHVASAKGIAESGYRVVTNNGPDAGQAVHHLHFHVLGGAKLRWVGV